uniref:cAMP-dependent protein kinase inhibitor beta n=1 Tax=Sinocyclocheilus grahami TaxID=75366 RepID=A0A672S5G4_SINGR
LQTESWKMTDVEPVVSDFEATGRTGRRNALPDILGSTDGPGAADLPDKLAELSVGGTVLGTGLDKENNPTSSQG